MLGALARMDPLAPDPSRLPRRCSTDSFQNFLLDVGLREGGAGKAFADEELGEGASSRQLFASDGEAGTARAMPREPSAGTLRTAPVAAGLAPMMARAAAAGEQDFQLRDVGGPAGPPAAPRERPSLPPLAPPPPVAATQSRPRGRARSDHGPETAQQRAHRRFYMRKKERVSFCVLLVLLGEGRRGPRPPPRLPPPCC